MRSRRPIALFATLLMSLTGAVACGMDDRAEQPAGPDGWKGGGGGSASAVNHPTQTDHLLIDHWAVQIGGDGRVYRPAEDRPAAGTAIEGTGHEEVEDETAPVQGLQTIRSVRGGLAAPAAPSAPALDVAPPDPPMPMEVAQLTPEGLRMLLNEAERLELLDRSTAPPTDFDGMRLGGRILIDMGDRTVEHRLTLVLSDAEGHADLERSSAFAQILYDVEAFVGDEIGPAEPYVPEAWIIRSGYSGFMGDHPIWDWPGEEAPEIGECTVLPSASHVDTAAGGYETDSGRRIDAHPAMPWDRC